MKLFNKIIAIMIVFALMFNVSFFESLAAEQDNTISTNIQDNSLDDVNYEQSNDNNQVCSEQVKPEVPYIEKEQNDMVVFVDDGIEYMPIEYRYDFTNTENQVNEVSAAIDDRNLYIKLKYTASANNTLCVFLQGDAPGLKELYQNGTKAGDNTVIIKLNKKRVLNYEAGLAVNTGDRNFIFIDKALLDGICYDPNNNDDDSEEDDKLEVPYIEKEQNETVVFEDDGIEYMPIKYFYDFTNTENQVNEVSAAIDNKNVYIKLKYTASANNLLCVFLQGDAPGLKELYQNGTKAGDNTVIIKLNKKRVLNYEAGLAVNTGDRNFIFIDKALLDEICYDPNNNDDDSEEDDKLEVPYIEKEQNEMVVFEDDGIEYMPIKYFYDFADTENQVNEVSAAIDNKNVYIKLKYTASRNNILGVFLQGDVPGLKELYQNGTKAGDNTVIIKLNKKRVLNYEAGLAVNTGDRNFIFIDKALLDEICYDPNNNDDGSEEDDKLKVPYIEKEQNETVVFEDDGIEYMPIKYFYDFTNTENQVNEVSAAIDNKNVYIKLKYTASANNLLCVFLQGDAPGLKELYQNGTKAGDNTVIIKLNKKRVLNYEAGLAVNTGDRNFIFIDKALLDEICYDPNNNDDGSEEDDKLKVPYIEKEQNETVVFEDDGIEYMPIKYFYDFTNTENQVNEVSAAIDNKNVYIKLKYTASANNLLCVFLQGDAPGLKELYQNGTKAGDNTVIIKLNKKKVLNYEAGLAVNTGDRNFIFIDKALLDEICYDPNNDDDEDEEDENKVPYIEKEQNEIVVFGDDGIKYMPINHNCDFTDTEDKVDEVSAAIDNENIYIKLKYTANADNYLCVFLQGDTPGLKEIYPNGTKAGSNTVIIKLNRNNVLNYKAGLAINIGDREFILIEKSLLDNICDDSNNSNNDDNIKKYNDVNRNIDFRVLPYVNKEQNDLIVFEDDNIEYMPISYGVEFDEKQCIVNDIGAVVDDNCVYIKMKYESSEMTDIGIFLQGNAEGLQKFYKQGVKQGENTVIIKLDKMSALNYPEGIGIIIGDRNYVFIEKQLIDIMCLIDVRLLNNYQ